MNTTAEECPREGEERRVIALSAEHIGGDAIVEFGDIDRPRETYRAAVMRSRASEGLSVGDECVIRFRIARGQGDPARWVFVERRVEVEVEAPIEELVGA